MSRTLTHVASNCGQQSLQWHSPQGESVVNSTVGITRSASRGESGKNVTCSSEYGKHVPGKDGSHPPIAYAMPKMRKKMNKIQHMPLHRFSDSCFEIAMTLALLGVDPN